MTPAQDTHSDRITEIYKETVRSLFAYCVTRSGSVEDAKDVVAETFLVAWRHIAYLTQLDPTLHLPWLTGVARRLMANQRRAQSRREQLLAALTLWETNETAVDPILFVLDGPTGGGDVYAALAKMGAIDREIIMLFALDALTYNQIAEVVSLSPAAVRTRLYRARIHMAECLTDHRPRRRKESLSSQTPIP